MWITHLITMNILVACSGHAPPEAPSVPAPSPSLASCLERHCAGSADLEGCAAERCAARDDVWAMVPQRINYEAGSRTIFVEARVHREPGGHGDVDRAQTEPVFAGVTLVTESGTEIDLAVQTRFETEISEPFFISAEADADVESVILGLWGKKIEPCTSSRHGCKEFGFVLDQSLASWPPRIYVDGLKQRIPPALLTLSVVNGGLPPEEAAPLAETALDRLRVFLAPFEVEIQAAEPTLSTSPASSSTIAVAHEADSPAAGDLALHLQGELPGISFAGHIPGAGGDIVLTLGGGESAQEIHGCLSSSCPEGLTGCTASCR